MVASAIDPSIETARPIWSHRVCALPR